VDDVASECALDSAPCDLVLRNEGLEGVGGELAVQLNRVEEHVRQAVQGALNMNS